MIKGQFSFLLLGALLSVGTLAFAGDTPNYFALLGLPTTASVTEIKSRVAELMQDDSLAALRDSYLDAYSFLTNDGSRALLVRELALKKARMKEIESVLDSAKSDPRELRMLEVADRLSIPVSNWVEMKDRLWLGYGANGSFQNARNFVSTFFLIPQNKRTDFYSKIFYSRDGGGLMTCLQVASKVFDPKQPHFEQFSQEFFELFKELLARQYRDPEAALRKMLIAVFQMHVLNSFDGNEAFEEDYPFEDRVLNLSASDGARILKDGVDRLSHTTIGFFDDFSRYQLGRLLVDLAERAGMMDVLQTYDINIGRIRSVSQNSVNRKNLSLMADYTRKALVRLLGAPRAAGGLVARSVLEAPRNFCGRWLGFTSLREEEFPPPDLR